MKELKTYFPKLRLQMELMPMADLPLLGLDVITLDAVAPTPTPKDEPKDETFSVLKEKMVADDYTLVDAVIRKVQKENGGTRGKTIANVFRDWLLDPANEHYAPHSG